MLSCPELQHFIVEYDPRHYSITTFYITTYCILKAACYSVKGVTESGAASDGEKRLGQNFVKGLEMFAFVCCAS